MPGSNEYAVVVPEGYFYLANLVTKIVVLMQPLDGGRYMPSAGFEQIALSEHRYVRFRVIDLLRAYAQHGDPTSALPYDYAIPFQDRFVYLLVGAELYLLAHETGHVVLGHLAEDGAVLTPEHELEADEFAMRVVSTYFSEFDEFSGARASLCGLVFNGLIRMWENMIHLAYGPEVNVAANHPSADSRYEHFVQLVGTIAGPTPPWYAFVFSGVSFAVTHLPDQLLPTVVERAKESGGLHARVLPAGSSLPARHASLEKSEYWWRTIAELVVAADPYERRLGLWFLLLHWPDSAEALYLGLLDNDANWADVCREVLISIEPLYENYLPRLRERFSETDRLDSFHEYIDSISDYLLFATMRELHPVTRETNPMSEDFFANLDPTSASDSMDVKQSGRGKSANRFSARSGEARRDDLGHSNS